MWYTQIGLVRKELEGTKVLLLSGKCSVYLGHSCSMSVYVGNSCEIQWSKVGYITGLEESQSLA